MMSDSDASSSGDEGSGQNLFVETALRSPPPQSAKCLVCDAEFNPEGLYSTACVDPKTGIRRQGCKGGFLCFEHLFENMESDLMDAAVKAVTSDKTIWCWADQFKERWAEAMHDKAQADGPKGDFNVINCSFCRENGVILAPAPVKTSRKPLLLQRFQCPHNGCPVAIDVCTMEIMEASMKLVTTDKDEYKADEYRRKQRLNGLYTEGRVRELFKKHEATCLFAKSQLDSVGYQLHGTFMGKLLTRLKRNASEMDTKISRLEHMCSQNQKEIDSLQKELNIKRQRLQ